MSSSIPQSQFLNGIRLCRRNAKKLFQLANEAHSKGCYHASYLLGFASLEETGKALLILNHINDEKITYRRYKKNFLNHEIKILESLKMIFPNLAETFARVPREAITHYIHEYEKEQEKLSKDIKDLRLKSIYVEYDFNRNKWERPNIDMKKDSTDIIGKAYSAYTLFLNESRHRGIKLRK